MTHATVDSLVERYDMQPHPEGGFYTETYRSDLQIPESSLPDSYDGPRDAGTSILYLLPADARSEWHRVRSDELWLYQGGRPLTLHIGDEPDTDHPSVTPHTVGTTPRAQPQVLVAGGQWQSATPVSDADAPDASVNYSLVACVVVPGFHPDDFELIDD